MMSRQGAGGTGPAAIAPGGLKKRLAFHAEHLFAAGAGGYGRFCNMARIGE